MTAPRGSIDEICVNTIRTLCIDAVQQAKSGHPGTPMAMAPVVYTLWQEFLRFDPEDPIWPNRDRFVLSAGHASTLLYAMLHLTGVKSVNEDYERLGNLCWIYDSNHITIEGNTALAFSEDVAGRFLAYRWHVQRVSDANDRERIADAIASAKRIDDRPSLIIVESHIGYGAPHKQDTSGAHGEPLGEEEVKLAKRSYGWPEDAKFLVPDGVYEHFQDGMGKRGGALRQGLELLHGDARFR